MASEPHEGATPGATGESELERLRLRVTELEDTIEAIRSGEVDALVVRDAQGQERLYTLSGPDTPYQVFVDHMREGALTVDEEGTILYSNARFAEMAGTPLESVIGARLGDFVAEHHVAELDDLLSQRTGARELELLHAEGKLVPIRWSSSILADGGRATLCLVVTETGVQRHMGQLQSLIGAMIEAMARPDIPSALRVLTQHACAIVSAKRGATSVTGEPGARATTAHYPENDLDDARDDDPIPAEVRRLVCAENRAARSSEQDFERIRLEGVAGVDLLRRVSSSAWLAAPLIAADGGNLGLVQLCDKVTGSFTDQDEVIIRHIAQVAASVVQTKRAEAALHESERRFRQLADSIPQLAWMAKSDGRIYWFNRRWFEYTGTSPEEMEQRGWESVHEPAALARVLGAWRESIQAGEPFEMEFTIRGGDGEFRPFYTLVRPLRDESGRIVQWFGTNTDVSAQHRLMEERNQLLEAERAARSEAERASRMKDEFVATLSHELRTPLNAILGWSYMIARGDVRKVDLQQGLETIERNARIQVQMIEDLLDMSRITSGKLRLDVQNVEFDAIVDAAVESIRPAAEAKHIALYRRLRSKVDRVAGDPHRLQQIVWNLLSNAVKFTGKDGSITVAVEEDGTHTRLSVTDDGIGIGAEFLPHVFDRFRQADGSTTRSYSGLGLGLSIVKQLVELHGGSIQVTSAGPGRGSTFSVRLPLLVGNATGTAVGSAGPLEILAHQDHSTLDGLSILYVDDEPDAREMIARILADHGAQVLTACSAAEARTTIESAHPDVLLSDIGMPNEDGYALIRSIRSLPEERGGRTAAAAVTALARAEDRDRALQAGFQTHIAKPVEARHLVAVVARLAGREVGA